MIGRIFILDPETDEELILQVPQFSRVEELITEVLTKVSISFELEAPKKGFSHAKKEKRHRS